MPVACVNANSPNRRSSFPPRPTTMLKEHKPDRSLPTKRTSMEQTRDRRCSQLTGSSSRSPHRATYSQPIDTSEVRRMLIGRHHNASPPPNQESKRLTRPPLVACNNCNASACNSSPSSQQFVIFSTSLFAFARVCRAALVSMRSCKCADLERREMVSRMQRWLLSV